MPSGILIEIPVTPLIKEFYESVHGNIILLKFNDRLSSVINPLLDVIPKKYTPKAKREFKNTVKIELLWISRRKVDIRHRNYLNGKAKKIIAEILIHDFKETYYQFMLGCIISGRSQKNSIELFCKIYNLSMNITKYESLKKAWYRSNTRLILNNFPHNCPQKTPKNHIKNGKKYKSRKSHL